MDHTTEDSRFDSGEDKIDGRKTGLAAKKERVGGRCWWLVSWKKLLQAQSRQTGADEAKEVVADFRPDCFGGEAEPLCGN
jgi:hypothetical protein